jgi:hypothetical protein
LLALFLYSLMLVLTLKPDYTVRRRFAMGCNPKLHGRTRHRPIWVTVPKHSDTPGNGPQFSSTPKEMPAAPLGMFCPMEDQK